MAITPKQTLTLDASGELTTTLDDSFHGLLCGFLVNENGQSNNPALVFSEVGSLGRTLCTVTHSATGATFYPVRELLLKNDGTSASEYGHYLVESGIQVAITGGDNAGTVTVQAQYIPSQG
jgi:hypothetical protein